MSTTCISYKIVEGDTLQRLAVKYNVDSWYSIAYLNDLQYPFILDDIVAVSDRKSNVAYLGDTILVPVTSLTKTEYLSDIELQKRTYGVDIYLDYDLGYSNVTSFEESQGQLSYESSGDIAQAAGVNNIKQALILRLSTRYGELPMHPDYGSDFPDMIGWSKTHTNLIKMKLEIMETFKKDTRVSDVTDCTIMSVTGGVKISCNIILTTPNASFAFNEIIAA